ncbi:universal stress protein [Solirubrobacter sp. CPCC 204708]|uniref:Universal stress protein n=1 Tax=Solirubrobacter deserti TaxID=2282478 RepID=A0ABT4RTV7_9ACTN|nr:universal stress protein [Solirubrobacter deserti]MBE2318680.1 universal stress protein [Solirubrobacter deserti]MDA0142009.1 universal stress protein [Solirubrobacter deserti]
MYRAAPEAHEFASVLARAAGTSVGEVDDPELIAVGRGKDAVRLLHGATCPVLVVPAGTRPEIALVGAAFDGRPQSRPALNTAISIADQLGVGVLTLGVHRSAALPGEHDPGRDDFEFMLGKVSFNTHGGANHRLLTGRPGPALAAASADVQLLVCGSSGHGTVREVVFGSVPKYLVEHASCPVLVVPRPPGRA